MNEKIRTLHDKSWNWKAHKLNIGRKGLHGG